MALDKQHGFTLPGFAPAYANVTVKAAEGDNRDDDRVVLSVRGPAKIDGSTGAQAAIEMTRRQFVDWFVGAAATLQP